MAFFKKAKPWLRLLAVISSPNRPPWLPSVVPQRWLPVAIQALR
jgi:hypothetical protein